MRVLSFVIDCDFVPENVPCLQIVAKLHFIVLRMIDFIDDEMFLNLNVSLALIIFYLLFNKFFYYRKNDLNFETKMNALCDQMPCCGLSWDCNSKAQNFTVSRVHNSVSLVILTLLKPAQTQSESWSINSTCLRFRIILSSLLVLLMLSWQSLHLKQV